MNKLDDFIVAKYVSDGSEHLVITHKKLHDHPPFGLTSRCRILVLGNEYVVHVLMREIERGYLDSNEDTVLNLCNKYSNKSPTHKLCPGLQLSEYETYKYVIRFDLKSVRHTSEPFIHIDSTSCLMWWVKEHQEIGGRQQMFVSSLCSSSALDSEQDSEMHAVSSTIDKMCPEEIEKLFAEDEHGVGSRLRNSDRRSEVN